MLHSDDWMENRIKWYLQKRGSFGKHAIVIDDTYGSLKREIEKLIAIKEIGRPIVCFVDGGLCWAIIGTKGLVYKLNIIYSYMMFDVMSKVSIKCAASTPPSQCDQLVIQDVDGESHTIHSPKGEACLSLCGLLMMLIKLRRTNDATVSEKT